MKPEKESPEVIHDLAAEEVAAVAGGPGVVNNDPQP